MSDAGSRGFCLAESPRRVINDLGSAASRGTYVLAQYTLAEPIGEADGFAMYRGLHSGRPVLLKLTNARPPPRDVIRLEHELELAAVLPESALKPLALASVEGRVALVLEYFAGTALSRLVEGPMEVAQLLKIAIGISGALADIHRLVVHRDLTPQHVLVDVETSEVKLTGFGIASLISGERRTREPSPIIEGTLAYMSPEMTRRTSHAVDSRSDLYSLGVLLYQLATGVLPFRGRDLLEWIHAHLARTPVPPQQLVAGLPLVVSDIILKLLAKTPDERYQTAVGLRADLERCLNEYATRGAIEIFPLATRDVSDRFEIPAKVYGRQVERAALRAAFARMALRGIVTAALIAGPSGAGKTTLARELQEPVVSSQGFFATGKCEQYHRQVPYAVIGQACSSLVAQLLALGDEEIGRWRTELTRAVGLHGRLITDLVPDLVKIIGEQPPVIELPVSQAKVRFLQVFWGFLSTFASGEHPLALVLDDLHWADTASLRLLQHILVDPDTRYVLFVGTYRPSEVDSSHPLRSMIDELRHHAIEADEIALEGLSVAEIDEVLQDTLRRPAHETSELAALVLERTAGNPFDVLEFLTALHREGLFRFDPKRAAWSWDLDRIRATRATENVVDLLLERVTELPASVLELVRLAACLGSRFTLDDIARVTQRSVEVVRPELFEASRRGLLIRMDGGYAFAHDRVQQAAYALVADADRPALHRNIGWLLAGDAPVGDELFAVASHLARGLPAIADANERRRAAAIELAAGRRARAGAAYDLAADFLSAGIACLDPGSWDDDYDTAYALHFELAQCRYLTANPSAAEPHLAELFARARARSETAALYRMKVELAWMVYDLDAAVDAVIACLRLFDVTLDRHPSAQTTAALYDRAVAALGQCSIEDLASLPETSDPDVAQLLATLSTAFPSTYWHDANLHFALSSLAVRVAIENGISPSAAHVFADFGMIIGALQGRYEDGYRFGRVAVELVNRPGYESVRAKVYMVFGGMTAHWTRPLAESSFVESAFAVGVQIGDLLHASNSCVLLLEDLLGSSTRLDLVHERAMSFGKFLHKVKFLAMAEVVACETKLIAALRGRDDGPQDSGGWWRDAQRARTRFGRVPCLIAQLQSALAFGDDEIAAELALEIGSDIDSIRGYWRVADYHFLAALALASRYRHVADDQKRRFLEQLAAHRDRYAVWARRCPENFLSRYALLCAELAAITGDDQQAMRRYEEAIAEGRKANSLSNEAIAYEMAARFYRSRGFVLIADTYLREARGCYRQWGAAGKVRWLDAQYPQPDQTTRGRSTGEVESAERIDVEALAKSLGAISSEIARPHLMSTIMRVVMQQAGADRGVLVQVASEQWSAEVEGVLADDELVIRAAPSALASVVPVSVIGRVATVAEPLVLADAERFLVEEGDGAYFAARTPRSALCVPVVRRATVVGAIYLEHHRLRGAFSPATVKTTELLASQLAISLENAELYGGLLAENTQRRAAENALMASEAHLQSVLDHMVDGVLACDATGRVTLANRAFEALVGIPRAELEGARAAEVATAIRMGASAGEAFAEGELPLQRALAGATGIDIPATFVRVGTDARVCVRISSAPIIAANRDVIGAVSVVHDVTASAQLEVMKEQFIRVAAHELKTPVTIMRLGAHLLLRTPATEPEKIVRQAELLAQGAERIHRIIDALLLLSVLQVRSLHLAVEPVELASLASQIVEEVARDYRGAIRLSAEPLTIEADRERLQIALAHLVDNAARYSPREGDIDVTVTRRGPNAVVRVRDRGIGIPNAMQPHIFECFFRAHTDTEFDLGGMGVGLYVSREIARQHGGDITFESEEGAGTTFEVTLPLPKSGEAAAHTSSAG